MSRRYLHFTDLKGAKGIQESGELWQTSYGPEGSVFAVVEGGHWVPKVQMSSMGRAKSRSTVLVFETDLLPDIAYPEEVMWHVPKLPIRVLSVISPSEAKKMLNGSIPQVPDIDWLKIELHPSFGVMGDWTRMPDDFQSWIPGPDTDKYMAAHKLWSENQDVDEMRSLWNDTNSRMKNEHRTKVMKLIEQEMSKLPVGKGEEWDTSTSDEDALEVEEDVYSMIDNSYKPIGGHPKFTSSKSVRGAYPRETLVDLDGDPQPDAVIMYSPRGVGTKYAVLASDGSRPGAMKALEMFANGLKSGGWAEVSGAPAHVLINKMGMKPVTDQETVQKLLAGKDIQWVGKSTTGKFVGTDGWYIRKIGGNEHHKIIVGTPNI